MGRVHAAHATGLAAILLITMTAAESQAQARFRHDGDGRVIAISNLSSGGGCFPDISTGTVTERQIENGAVRFITFRDQQHGDIGINVPSILGVDAATQDKLAAAYDALLQPGQPLRIGYQVCGAAGRIKKLDAISLVGARAAPASPGAGAQGGSVFTRTPGATDPDQVLLRSPGAAPEQRVAAAQPPVVAPPSLPAPPLAAAKDAESKDGWSAWSDGGVTTMSVVNGMHFDTIWLRCTHRTGMVELLVDDPKGRYRVGSRQSFTLTSGMERVSAQGKTTYNDMDDVRQIEARAPFDAVGPVIGEIARGNPLVITTRAGRTTVATTGFGKAAPTFLAACSGGR